MREVYPPSNKARFSFPKDGLIRGVPLYPWSYRLSTPHMVPPPTGWRVTMVM